jgi:hypothetical protein
MLAGLLEASFKRSDVFSGELGWRGCEGPREGGLQGSDAIFE